MEKTISEHVMVGKLIRNHLKKIGFTGMIRASAKGGTSVDIFLNDLSPRAIQEITLYCDQFKAGSFNSMTDSYEYNHKKSGHSVQYISINNTFSDELRQKAFDVLRTGMYAEDMSHLKPLLSDNSNVAVVGGELLSQLLYRALTGFYEEEACAIWGSENIKRDIQLYTISENHEIEVIEEKETDLSMMPIPSLGFLEVSQTAC